MTLQNSPMLFLVFIIVSFSLILNVSMIQSDVCFCISAGVRNSIVIIMIISFSDSENKILSKREIKECRLFAIL